MVVLIDVDYLWLGICTLPMLFGREIAARSQRNAARAKLGPAVGNPKECDHKKQSATSEAIEKIKRRRTHAAELRGITDK